jgi:hypothetical protein
MDSNINDLCNKKREEIVKYARRLADEGAHYLWGAAGEKPGENGLILAPPVLDKNRPKETIFCAATLKNCVCVGRCGAIKSTKKVWDLTGENAEVAAFISRYQNTLQVGWGSELTPRLISGYPDKNSIPTDYSRGDKTSLLGKIVWGEGCDDTQHFDCGGFIRYVVKQVCSVNISGFDNNPNLANAFGRLSYDVDIGTPILPGDILVYHGHIAFVDFGNNTNYSRGGSFKVVHAEGAVSGVNYGRTRTGDIRCIRLSSATLLKRKNET